MNKLDELFGSNVFNDAAMARYLPRDVYLALKQAIQSGRRLDPKLAAAVADGMKEWAVSKGVTHYSHWFQPMTGFTAEKHDSFISPLEGGKMTLSFSGSELIRGESDASSFPSGGLRSTFEARGYTAWDPTSYAFIKDGVLCIPTAFCAYGGEALDKKTPLLRSMDALNRQALRILRLFGRDAGRVLPMVGPEQEYFLVDRKLYDLRKDLVFSGRTLFGARPPKGQETSNHYAGTIKPRVQAFMNDLNVELWKLGVCAKTEHNETAPAQHEMAPVYGIANVAADHNQLTMEIMQKVAERHGLVCLLHEKPFSGVNGSGKHNNWSISTDKGDNLLAPGDSPYESAQFLLFLVAVLKAVDDYQDLLRASVAAAGNDHRLGANEAPPAIISVFLGDELTEILEALESGAGYQGRSRDVMTIGVHCLPKFPRDTTDRNRTSPFAFTGNKFEFRSLGASESISDTNTVLNTIAAESLRAFADELEQAEDFQSALHTLIVREIRNHKRIVFNGNNYTEAWREEAKRRGLSCYNTTPDVLPCLLMEKNIRLFEEHRVMSEKEMRSRYEIMLDTYSKAIRLEAETMLLMVNREILPAVIRYTGDVAARLLDLKKLGMNLSTAAEEDVLKRMTDGTDALNRCGKALAQAVSAAAVPSGAQDKAEYMCHTVIPAMEALRNAADSLEEITGSDCWPFPTYSSLLFSI